MAYALSLMVQKAHVGEFVILAFLGEGASVMGGFYRLALFTIFSTLFCTYGTVLYVGIYEFIS